DNNEVETKALNSGEIKDNKGVNVPNVSVNLPGITEKDANDILFGVEQGVDFIAASFVRRSSDVLEIRKLLEQNHATHIQIIPKIENQEGVDNIDSILEVTDGIMVARGDLGVEIPFEEVPIIQKQLIDKCKAKGKLVVTATQMLESMINNHRPTREEASNFANAIVYGIDAIMLSGETAKCSFTVEAVNAMVRIATKIESSIDYVEKFYNNATAKTTNITDAISYATCTTANDLNAPCIVAVTKSGLT